MGKSQLSSGSRAKKLMAERDSPLEEILTPEQFTRYQELQAKQAKEQAARLRRSCKRDHRLMGP